MSRILQPSEIKALDQSSIQRIRLPNAEKLFSERVLRLEQLTQGNAIADYLRFATRLVRAQAAIAVAVVLTPVPTGTVERAQQYAMPLLNALGHLDPAWRKILVALLDILDTDTQYLPAHYAEIAAKLRHADDHDLDAQAIAILSGHPSDLGSAPFITAALQVAFACRAGMFSEVDVPQLEPSTVCPVCSSLPVASVIRHGFQGQGYRYLHCGVCETEWHQVRVSCSHCGSVSGIAYEGIAGGDGVVLAETCSECGTYRKIVNQEKDIHAEPLADDLATLSLDLLMSETSFTRASANPLLCYTIDKHVDV